MQMAESPSTAWHTQTHQDASHTLGARIGGLTQAEANDRRNIYGPNELPDSKRPSRLLILARQLNNPLTFILFVAAAVSFALGETTDGAFICAVVIINVSIGAVQEWRAEASAASLKKTLSIRPTVVRAGARRSIDITEIVPGDIVHLESGSVVPADMRLNASHDLRIDESLLTGESKPTEKNSEAIFPEHTPLGDRTNMAYAGAMVVAGRGAGIVCATGRNTQIGSIAQMLSGRDTRPPLLIRMERFSNRIGVFIVLLAIAIGAGQFYQGVALSSVFLLTVALVVSAIPEGLPVAITVALSIASARMGKRNVIVRRLPAVEALGSCTLIATDKTGTLTANRLTIKKIVTASGCALDVEGEGLELVGAMRPADGATMDGAAKKMVTNLARAGALTNEADIGEIDGAVEARGDAVDVAFLVLAEKLGIGKRDLDTHYRRRATLPYEPQQGFSAAIDIASTSSVISVKGAPETVLPMCKGYDASRTQDWLHTLASQGYRVIAVAQRESPSSDGSLSKEDLNGLEFSGFVGLIDPLRSEAPEAVAKARAAGVDVRMITGDHPDTALAIARQLDPSWLPDTALTGAQLAQLEGDDLRRNIRNAAVFARVEPAQKTLIVKELQADGHFVAVTGDGANDAPALKKAHVGVAMGAGGTDVARSAADLILTDDNFASIVGGIEEGRASYDNIRKIVFLLISTAITEVLLYALALMAGLPLPLTAVQILWLNLVTEGIQDVALAFEGKEPDIMKRPPRSPKEPIFNRQMIEQCAVIGFYIGSLAFGLFYWLHIIQGYGEETARNLVLLFLVSFNNVHTLNCRSERRSAFTIPLRANRFLIFGIIGAQAVHIFAMNTPVLSGVLDASPVSVAEWAGATALAATVLAVSELYKLFVARPRARRIAESEGQSNRGNAAPIST